MAQKQSYLSKSRFRQAGSLVASSIRKSGESRGFAIARILTHWAEIVGPDLADTTHPVKVRYGREGLGATLTVLVSGAHAPMVEMQKDRIRDRVNAVYGYSAISQVQLTQTAPTGFSEGKAAFKPAPKTQPAPPSPEVQGRSHKISAIVKDDALRLALGQLGTNILAKPKPEGRS